MLLPPSMQDMTEFMPLGKAIQKPEPVKADPVLEFEKHNHDIPGAPKLPRVTPEMASRALRSLCPAELGAAEELNREYPEPWESLFQKQAAKQAERLDKLSELSKPPALTWPTLPDLPEPTFLPEVVNEAVSDELLSKLADAEKRVHAGFMVLEVERRLATCGFARVNATDMDSMREWFGPLGFPSSWLGNVSYSTEFQRMSV